ncbi:MAG TPA: N-acetyl-alpha-D-glucosaminyl L-malate synthase BshA [Fibrobacteres bacterium]|nr:N-acetyl-alpha-D-glucosaminyl L-malate synthase BshA [Fibrobacterota bacterium]
MLTPTYPLFREPQYLLSLANKIVQVAREFNLDVIHAHYAVPHATAAFLSRQVVGAHGRAPKVVTTLHGTDITLVGQEKSFFELTRFGIEQSSAVTAVSDYLKRKTEEVFNPQKKIRRIYNFADSALFHRRRDPCHRPSFSTPGQVVYMHLSNFRPVKRVEDVIRIFAKAAQTVDAVLVMIGEGPTQRPARDLAAQLGVANRVRFLGNQQDVPSLMGCGDIFLFPSELESFGLAPLEAMACEMPVIASDSGGVPEVVVHGESGYLAPVGDVDRMAEYAIELGRSPELRAKMGTAGRKRAETVFTPEIAMEQYEALYKEVMNAAK